MSEPEKSQLMARCYQLGETVAMTIMKWDDTGVIGSREICRAESAESEVHDIAVTIGDVAKHAFDDGFAAVFMPPGTYVSVRE